MKEPLELVDDAAWETRMNAQLAACGAAITDADLRDLYGRAERSKGEFAVAAIRFGLALHARLTAAGTPKGGKPETLRAFCARVFDGLGADTPDRYKSFSRYRALARRYLLAACEPFRVSGSELAKTLQTAGNIAAGADIFALIAATEESLPLAEFVRGRSLNRLMADFRRADDAAEADELAERFAEEETRREKKKQKATEDYADDPVAFEQTQFNLIYESADSTLAELQEQTDALVEANAPRDVVVSGLRRLLSLYSAHADAVKDRLREIEKASAPAEDEDEEFAI